MARPQTLLTALLLVIELDDPPAKAFERLTWPTSDSAKMDTARELLVDIIALRTAERGESDGNP